MFIDSSAFMAILLGEDDTAELLLRLQEHRRKPITSPSVRYEVVVSLARNHAKGGPVTPEGMAEATEAFERLMTTLGCSEVMVTSKIGRMAVEAAAVYGKVAGHPAELNMGDCLSYAAAKANGAPLLYKGRDFAQTDLA